MVRQDIVWTFKGGRPRHATLAATAGNVVANLSPGVGKRWLILNGRVLLVADGNAANRYIILRLTDGTTITRAMVRSAAVTLGQTRGLSFADNISPDTASSLVDDNAVDIGQVGLGTMILEGADQFRIVVNGGLAGDSYTAIITVLEVDV